MKQELNSCFYLNQSSNKDSIKKLKKFGFLMSKNFRLYSYNFRRYNNSAKDKEIIYYSYVPQEK